MRQGKVLKDLLFNNTFANSYFNMANTFTGLGNNDAAILNYTKSHKFEIESTFEAF